MDQRRWQEITQGIIEAQVTYLELVRQVASAHAAEERPKISEETLERLREAREKRDSAEKELLQAI